MSLLVFYLVLAIGVSFVCSLCEAVLLTLTRSDAELMSRRGNKAGDRLRAFKESIDRPLAAILTLNTISHTVGAAGVGAQSAIVFGSAWLGATSAVLTLLILVVSEIIPKTLGATHARFFASSTIWMIVVMVWFTYPVVVALDTLSVMLRRGRETSHLSREQIEVLAEMARTGGILRPSESQLMTNMLRLQQLRVEQIMTPRTVMRTTSINDTVADLASQSETLRFSRIPIVGDGPDDIRGYVLKHDVHRALVGGRGNQPLAQLVREIRAVPENADLVALMEQFGSTGAHIFVVVDEYGGTSGIVTLEDLLETILGAEIVDETDPAEDMQIVARSRNASGDSNESE